MRCFFFPHTLCNPSELGTKEEPLLAEVINPVQIKQQNEIREKLAALKEKRLLNQKLGYEMKFRIPNLNTGHKRVSLIYI